MTASRRLLGGGSTPSRIRRVLIIVGSDEGLEMLLRVAYESPVTLPRLRKLEQPRVETPLRGSLSIFFCLDIAQSRYTLCSLAIAASRCESVSADSETACFLPCSMRTWVRRRPFEYQLGHL